MFKLTEYLDIRTLTFISLVLHLLSAMMMLGLYQAMRKAPGLLAWMAGNVCCVLGFGLLQTHVLWARVVNVLVSNLLIDLGAALAFVAVLQFLERPRAAYRLLVPAAVLGLIEIAYYMMYGANYIAITLLGCGLRALMIGGAAWQLFRHADQPLRPASTFSAIFHALWAVALLSRAGWWITSQYGDSLADPTTAFGLLFRIILIFVITPSYFWMIMRRLDHEHVRQARQDPLTGIANRRTMWEDGERLTAATLKARRSLGLLMIDIDHFKAINDRYGHGAGDRVLIAVARTLADTIRRGDLLARIGGEEFLVLLPDSDGEETVALAERLRVAIATLDVSIVGQAPLRCTISIGCSLLERDGAGWDDIVSAADRALYRAKHLGRNRVEQQQRAMGLSAASCPALPVGH
jgi:diguanylate cyclase (GGDEF)-like protein